MKNVSRRALSVICALALLVSCLAISVPVFAASNLAAGATAFIKAVHASYGAEPSTMTDENLSTRWQSGIEVGQDAPIDDEDYCGIVWTAAQTFDTVISYWEASQPKEGNAVLYYAASPAVLTELAQTRWTETVYTDNGTVWTRVGTATTRTEGTGGPSKVDTWQLDAPVTAYAIKIGFTQSTDTNKNISCHEIEVFDYSSGTPYDFTEADRAVEYVNKAFGATNVYGYSDASWTAFVNAKTAVANAQTTYSGENVEDHPGFTQADLDALIANIYAKAACLTGNGTITTNLLENGIMIYNQSDMQSYASGNNYRTLTDGLYANDSNSWQPKNTSTPVYLKLNNASDVNKFVIVSESDNETYGIEYTTADVTAAATVADMEALGWTATGAVKNYAVKDAFGNGVAYEFYSCDAVSNVTAIKLTCTQTNGGWCKLREVMAFNDADLDNSITETKTFANGDSQQFVCTNISAAAVEGRSLVANYTITRGGTTASGSVNVEYAYAIVDLGGTAILADSFANGHMGDYVAGVLFDNLEAGDVVDVTFTIA